MTSLSDHLIAAAEPEDAPTTPEERQWFVIDNDDKAGWALRKLARAQQEIARIDEAADLETARVERWRSDTSRGPEGDAEFFAGALKAWHRRNVEKEAAQISETAPLPDLWDRIKGKTRKLPAGTMSARRQPDGVALINEDALVAWAQQAGRFDLLRIKPDMSAVKAEAVAASAGNVVSKDGEFIPGVIAAPGRITFSVKADTSVEQPAWLPEVND